MAARVNVRFVAILCTIVGVIFVGMAGAAYFIVKKSAADHFETGQALYQQGDYVEAERAFSKAVNKERTNTVYLETWIKTIEQLTPETRTKYSDVYFKDYVPGIRQLAVAKRTDAQAWEKYLQTLYEQREVFGAESRTGWQMLLTESNSAIEYFLVTPEADNDDADWHRLRRYRALSNLRMRSGTGQADPDFQDKTILDFEAALRVDPSDAESAVGLYEWLMAEAELAEESRDDSRIYIERAGAVLDSFLANNPSHPRALLASVFYDLRERARPLRDLRTQEERIRANAELIAEFAPRVDATIERVLTESDPSQLNVDVAELVNRLERVVKPGAGIPLTERVMEAARRANGDNPGKVAMLDFFEGAFLADSGDHERAIAAFERVMQAPLVPVSLEGIILTSLLGQAALMRTESAIDLYTQAEGEAAEAAKQRVVDLRGEIDEYWPQGTPALLLLDARIALMNRELADAQRLATAYQRESGVADPEASFLLGRVYMERNQPGQALQELERFVDLSPNVPGAWLQLSALRERLGDRDGAMEAITRAASLAPDDPAIQERLKAMRVLMNVEQSTDPVTQVLVAVDRLVDTSGGVSPKYDEAITLVEQAIARIGDDEKLYTALVRLYGMKGENTQAIETADRAIELYPQSQTLAQMRTALRFREGEIPDNIQGIRRTMLEYRQAIQAGRDDEAVQLLERAIGENPDDPELLQILIRRSIAEQDFEDARRYVSRATELDIDQAGGRILRSDLLEAEGRPDEALAVIDSVIADGLTSVPVLYRRARILRGLGRIEDAVGVFEDILRRQPDSVANVREVIASLEQLGRTRRALEIARYSQRVAGSDPGFVDLWLRLEAEVGDATAAMLRREDIRDAQPDNRQNNFALANVYLKLGEWAKARPLIDQLRADSDDIALVLLDARWHAGQAGLARAIQVFDQYLGARRDAGTLSVADVLVYSNFLQAENEPNRAIALIRGSMDIDDSEDQPLAKRLAVLLLSTNRTDEAVEVMDGLIASGADRDGVLELARVESFIRGGMLDRAESALNSLSPAAKSAEASGILTADLAARRGDRRAALSALSDTLAAHPTSAQAYIRRAELLWSDIQTDADLTPAERAQTVRDATGDLREALKHNPQAWEAHRLLGLMAIEDNRYDDAARHFARAIEIQPGLSGLRSRLVARLVEEGDTPRAMTIIDRAIESNPGDVDLRVGFARLMAELDRPSEAVRLFESALAQRRNPEIAAQLVEFLLKRGRPQDLSKAQQVLSDPNLNVAGTWQLQLMEAAVSLAQGNRPRAIAEARRSFESVRPNTANVVSWFNTMPALFTDHAARMEIALQLAVENTPDRVGEIMLASLMLQDPSTEQQGMDDLRRLAQDRNATVRLRSGQLLGDTLYRRSAFQEAAQAWEAVIDQDPTSGQSLNNLAFVLATELDDCDRAIELGLRALESTGVARPIVLSTLTVAYLQCGRLDDAQRMAAELESLSRGSPEEALAAIRSGQVALAQGQQEAAQAQAIRAESLIDTIRDRAEAYRPILEEFKNELG